MVLEVGGETLLAWTNLPLVRGQAVRAVVESAGAGLRLRVIGEMETRAPDLPRALPGGSAVEPDELDVLIARSAADLGMAAEETLLFGVRERLATLETRLGKEAVPLRRITEEVRTLLLLESRGIPPSDRARRGLLAARDARLGTALARLIESLESTAGAVRGDVGTALRNQGEGLRSFYFDLGRGGFLSDLPAALRRCGYAFEHESAARGLADWHIVHHSDDTLKGRLLWLQLSLAELKDAWSTRSGDPARRDLEGALAWCGRALDLIEGLQILNLHGRWGGAAEAEIGFQLPVRWRSSLGSLLLWFAGPRSRFWLDLAGREPFGADWVAGAGEARVTLYVPEALEARILGDGRDCLTEAVEAAGLDPERIRCRLVRGMPDTAPQVDDALAPVGGVDCVF